MKTADTAYINGRVYTADKEFSIRSAFALSGDRFIAAGSDEEIRALCSSQTKIIDLKGRTVLPGLIDSHLHINNTGAMKLELDIVGKQKQEIVLDAVCPDFPVYLKRACGHGAWVNSKAFETVGVTNDTPDPVGGEYLRKPDGSLLGVVTDQAQEPFNKAIPPYGKEQLQKIVLLAQDEFFSHTLPKACAQAAHLRQHESHRPSQL